MNLSRKGVPVSDIKQNKKVAPCVVISILSNIFKPCRWPPSCAAFDKVRRQRSRLGSWVFLWLWCDRVFMGLGYLRRLVFILVRSGFGWFLDGV